MARFVGNFQWACDECGRIWFMEVDANKCHPPLPYINWKPGEVIEDE